MIIRAALRAMSSRGIMSAADWRATRCGRIAAIVDDNLRNALRNGASTSAAAPVRAGDHLEVVAVGRGEVEAAAAVVGVVARRAVAGVGERRDAALAQALGDGVELVLGDQERVVLGDDLVAPVH